jgi:putative mRNA 3-end processing factor
MARRLALIAMDDHDLVVERPQGLYCPAGDFYIDPWQPVDRAVITHAHADHARRGHGHYLATPQSAGVLRARLGDDIVLQTLAYGETLEHHGVRVSLHPAGHVLGSAQVRLQHEGRVWVVSGDYWVSGHDEEHNATCAPFAIASSASRRSAWPSTAGRGRPRCSPTSMPGGAATRRPAARVC